MSRVFFPPPTHDGADVGKLSEQLEAQTRSVRAYTVDGGEAPVVLAGSEAGGAQLPPVRTEAETRTSAEKNPNANPILHHSQAFGRVERPRLADAGAGFARTKDWDAVAMLLHELGPSVLQGTDEYGSTVLHWAIRHGHVQFAKDISSDDEGAFLGLHADISAYDSTGMTPLMLAAVHERTRLFFHLLEVGADWEQTNEQGVSLTAQLDGYIEQRSRTGRGPDCRLERMVLDNFKHQFEDQLARFQARGVDGMLEALMHKSVVMQRKACDVLRRWVRSGPPEELGSTQTEVRVKLRDDPAGVNKLLDLVNLSQRDGRALRSLAPATYLLSELARGGYFPISRRSVEILRLLLTCIEDSVVSPLLRCDAALICRCLAEQGGDHASELLQPVCGSLYLLAHFSAPRERRTISRARATLLALKRPIDQPQQVQEWTIAEVCLWACFSLNFPSRAVSIIAKEEIDGMCLLNLSEDLINSIQNLTLLERIKLKDAVDILKQEYMSWNKYDCFFSYRRSNGLQLAQLYNAHLRPHYQCFLDIKGLVSGKYEEQLLDKIKEVRWFIAFITEGSVERMQREKDFVRKEIRVALEHKKTIIPICYKVDPPKKADLPEDIQDLCEYQAITHDDEDDSDEMVKKLIQYMENGPEGVSSRRRALTQLSSRSLRLSGTFNDDDPVGESSEEDEEGDEEGPFLRRQHSLSVSSVSGGFTPPSARSLDPATRRDSHKTDNSEMPFFNFSTSP